MKQKPVVAQKLALLRELIHKSQAQFAALVGVSKETIISVENGRNQLSKKLALRIFICTGANLLTDETTGKWLQPDLVPGEGYDLSSFAAFTKSTAEVGLSGGGFYREKLSRWLDVLFKATEHKALAGNPHTDSSLAASLFEWIHEQRNTLKLGPEMDRILEEETRKVHRECDYVGMLRQNPDEVKRYAALLGLNQRALQQELDRRDETDLIMIKYEIYEPFRWLLLREAAPHRPVHKPKLLPKPKYWFKRLPKESVSPLVRQITRAELATIQNVMPVKKRTANL
jgi:DNA-binding XRE family transcriptional regulator